MKRQEARNKKQETRNKKQEAGSRKLLSCFMLHASCLMLLASCFMLHASCSGSQFAGWHVETFDQTQITASAQKEIFIANKDLKKEQHVRAIGFDKGSNRAGHFRVDQIKVGEQAVGMKDIVIPPGGALTIIATYTPQDLETTYADYGGWVTGEPERWIPHKPGDEPKKDNGHAIHRALLQMTYDYPRDGIVQIELVGEAVPGPNGEIMAGGKPGECTPGEGTACYTGGFSIDIPKLYSGGPKELEFAGAVRFSMSGSDLSLRMDDFPPALWILRSSEIPQLPSGVSGTLIVSGGLGKTATGTFDGSRISLKDVVFRIRFVLGEITADDITPGMSAMIDFEIPNLEIETTEPFAAGQITMHLETTLSQSPSGNELFDQFLSGAKVMVTMKGELNF